ncbi:MAG: hypothetical protein LC664_02430 [Flavobacteriales bacterium]|nr:hypothetical protein [Flavobacteriales bacterium]
MKYVGRKICFVFALVVTSNLGFGQPNEITVRFIGNCGLYLTDGELNVYVDFPYKSGAFGYMEYDEAQLDSIKEDAIFIFTHKHGDHYSRKHTKRVLKAKNGEKFTPWNISKLEKRSETIPDFDFEAFKTKHRFSFNHYSYLITWHGKKIYLSGDTESAETIGKVDDMDWAFIPYWILYDAEENDIEIKAKMKALYHLYPQQKIEGEIPDDMVVLNVQNQLIRIPY